MDNYRMDTPRRRKRYTSLRFRLVALLLLSVAGLTLVWSRREPSTPNPATLRVIDSKPFSAMPPETELSPLNDFMLGSYWTYDTQSEISDSVATCMRERGWKKYEAEAPSRSAHVPASVGELLLFSETEGFGLSDALVPSEGAKSNETLVSSLTEQDRERYFRDLTEGDSELTGRDAEPWGCQARAEDEHRAGLPFFDPSARPHLAAAFDRILQDAQLRESLEDYRRCMEDNGVVTAGVGQPPAALIAMRDRTAASASADDLAKFRSEEIRVAGLEARCRLKTVVPVAVAIETQAVDELKVALPQYANRS